MRKAMLLMVVLMLLFAVVPVNAQDVQPVLVDESPDIDYTVIISVAIIAMATVLSVFGGVLVIQGRQLLNSVPPWMKDIIVFGGNAGLDQLGEVVDKTETEIDNEALAELIKWWTELTKADGDLINPSGVLSVKPNDEAYG